ncbi:MAG: NADH-ubiquinone oxidoreductase-F iron-sulfur binding region domain-containing protein [Dehalococcoidia bacterium]
MAPFEDICKRAEEEWRALEQSPHPRLMVGSASCGRAAGAPAVLEAIEAELQRHRLEATVIQVGCLGLCYTEPLLDITKPGGPRIFYGDATPELASQLVRDYLLGDNPHPDLALGTMGDVGVEGIPKLFDLPMLKPQVRIVLKNCGHIDPESITHYIAQGGYHGFTSALEMGPEGAIDEVKRAGLRGRGGAGFPTWQKWQFCRNAPGDVKYLVCNADEGDPGAFMNRSVLEGDPHALLEGMLIAGYALGATEGFIYCRAEYPLAVHRLGIALKQAAELGLMGENILGSGFSFHIQVREGAGAFVCGEETALLASIEGKRGTPRPRPPFPAVKGLWGKPTNINNVETLSTLPHILREGAEWYSGKGSELSKGTKTFSLVGKVKRTGLIEIPLGSTLGDIIFGVGGGLVGDKGFKAAQTGGPSGGCLPSSALDLPIEYEALAQAGSIMGSGGLIVMDDYTCAVDLARFFLTFTKSESCGKCVPCRVGTGQMLQMLERFTRGEGKPGDIEKLLALCDLVKNTSLCGLGQTAPNPVLTTVRYFREEYEEHINKRYCRAAVCKGLVEAPCSHICPAGIDVPRYVRLCAEGKYAQAFAVNRERVPFPSVLGRVCFHPCEARCRRGQLEEPIGIRMLKRIASERDDGAWRSLLKKAPPTGKRVAVVGSGPAGLTAAYYLATGGHAVTVFEALPQAGGMMRVAIPEYRLPREVLDAEIEDIERAGVEIRTATRVESLDSLMEQGYDAVFLGLGAHRGAEMGVEGQGGPAVVDAVDFLRRVTLGEGVSVGEKVAVVGGGNAAIDAARCALRLGATSVSLVYRRTRDEMPASPEEVEAAIEEGVEMVFLAAPCLLRKQGSGVRLECDRMRLGEIDSSGRRRPEAIPDDKFSQDFDTVIAAIGQVPEVPRAFALGLGRGNTITVDPDSMATSRSGVFAGGDCVIGPASVIEAIAHGRQAAISIDRYLGGSGDIGEVLLPPEAGEESTFVAEEGERHRPPMAHLPPEKRMEGYPEVELGYSDAQAVEEAQRCLKCDLEE